MELRVASAAERIEADESMVIAGGILPRFAKGREGELRATAVALRLGDETVCLVSCDVLMLRREDLDRVCERAEAELGLPRSNLLIASTHTHHAPSTVRIHGYSEEPLFLGRVREAILGAVSKACEGLSDAPPVRALFRLGIESSVGQNSRLLLGDGTIYWVGPRDDAIRPTGPFDPDLPVIAFERPDGKLEALIFSHSTHNIGARRGNVISPGFYGLAAQELEGELGCRVAFLPGAFGSSHNLTLSTDEMVHRIKEAVEEALSKAEEMKVDRLRSIKEEFEFRVRRFDEEREEEAVSYYCRRRLADPEPVIEVFRGMRRELAGRQGEVRRSWLQVVSIGDVKLVGVPGEMFTSLGIDLKRRSPFRYTFPISLANDWIGYIPDEKAFELGGYQVWTGFHSFVERGTGEMIVERALEMLKRLGGEG